MLLGLKLTRSNQVALLVLVLSGGALAALLWSPAALTQAAARISVPFPVPSRDPPVDPPGAPLRALGRRLPPEPTRGLRLEPAPEAVVLPIPQPTPEQLAWRPDRSQPAPSCELGCQHAHNDELRYCAGYVTAEQAAREGRAAPQAGCARALYREFQSCMSRCGLTVRDPIFVPEPRARN